MAKEAKTTKTPSKKVTAKKTTTKKAQVKKTSTAPKAVKTTKKAKVQKQTKLLQEENNYKNTIIAAVVIALIFIVGLFIVKTIGSNNEEENYVQTADEAKFQQEYESLNGTESSEVKIIKDNNIEYIDMKQAAEILDSKSGVIYFGFANDELSRAAVPALLDAMSSSDLKTIYYVNLRPENKEEKDVRDLYSLNAKNKAKIARAATEEYNLVRLALANHLNDYVLYTSKGKKVNTGQKRLEAPTVISVVEGQIMGFHEGTVDNHDGENSLTKDQVKELKAEYTKVISSQLNKKCMIEEGC